jgi:hypothetical protein
MQAITPTAAADRLIRPLSERNSWLRAVIGLGLTACGPVVFAAGHCQAAETTYFSCRIKDTANIASLCGASPSPKTDAAAASDGWMQYRFGPADRIEFSFPADKKDSLAEFDGERLLRPRSSAATVTFRHQGVSFTVVSNTGELAFTGVWLALEKVRAPDMQCEGVPEVDRLRDAIRLVSPGR